MKTAELTGPALDWAVAKCEGKGALLCGKVVLIDNDTAVIAQLRYSTDWAQGGPIIEKEGIDVLKDGAGWTALKTATAHHGHIRMHGPTPLIAAMRCYVASKLGDEVEIPEELK
mgnify:CR=1 FL=1